MSDLTRQVFSLILLMPGLLTLDSRGGLRVAPWTLL